MMPQREVGWQVFASAWWDKLDTIGPKFVYHPNAGKMWLVVKPECLQAAEMHFQGTGVKITGRGQRHLAIRAAWVPGVPGP